MKYERIDNGHYICIDSGIEYMSTWKFEKTYHKSLDDILTAQFAKKDLIYFEKTCPIEFEGARKLYGDFVNMYPVEWLKTL
ncbi:hypothetical protein [Pseudoalteromonas spongiae]|uniref:hypothetical protein n=1 Tax=Pseudoalteromonas spongiae TaxID=298657 RepID=UPI000C2D341C|nr:hypothetical protein [Pseudoalteromonas spongiae]